MPKPYCPTLRKFWARVARRAALYSANATAAIADITTWCFVRELSEVHEGGFVTYHDAFQYFEAAYDITVVGTILDGHATQAAPAKLAQLQPFD